MVNSALGKVLTLVSGLWSVIGPGVLPLGSLGIRGLVVRRRKDLGVYTRNESAEKMIFDAGDEGSVAANSYNSPQKRVLVGAF